MTEYQKLARDFCKNTGTSVHFSFKGCNTCPWDEKPHNQYSVTIKRNDEEMTVNFWDSLINTWEYRKPTAYDVLACLQKYDVGTHYCNDDVANFILEYGFEIHSDNDVKKALDTFIAVEKEYADVKRVFGDVIDELREIY